MNLVNPFAGLRPLPEYADEVIAPPYDVIGRLEAYDIAHNQPWSFLHISKPEIDLPFEVDQYDPRVYVKGMSNYRQMLIEGVLQQDAESYYYLYRITNEEHSQVGLVAAMSIEGYFDQRILQHETTRPSKEQDRVRHMTTVNAQTSPVMLTYRPQQEINELISQFINDNPPVIDTFDEDDVQHEFWVLKDPGLIQAISHHFNHIDSFYIAEGHHRSAAAAQVAKSRARTLKNQHGAHNYFLACLFPADQLEVLSYNRIITDLNELSIEDFLQQVSQVAEVTEVDDHVVPTIQGELGMYLEDQWYHLRFRPELIIDDNILSRLDVSLLDTYILNQILGIHDLRTDNRIDFIGGHRSIEGIEDCIDSGEATLGFSLYPTKVEDLMSISDLNQTLPPKSTWFEPKLADGLICLSLDS